MSNTPKIRFKGFTDDWEQRKFGDVGSVSMCKRIFKDETSDDGDIPFYKIGTFGGTPDAYISRELFEEYKSKFSYPDEGDILLSASGTIGRIVEYNGEEAYFQDSNIVWLKHDKSISNKFLKVLYPTVKWDGIEGSTIQRLYNDNFLKTRFLMPSLQEQEKLGDYFSQFDNLITLHQRKCDETKELKKYMLQKMFPTRLPDGQGNGETKPEIRFAGFTDDWEQRKVSELVDYSNGTGHEDYVLPEGKYELITLKSISSEGELVSSGKYVNEEFETLKQNTLIMMLSEQAKGMLGMTTVIPCDNRYVLNQRVAALTLHDKVSSKFLTKAINIKQSYFEQMGAGTKVQNISRGHVENCLIEIPKYDEQKQIGVFFDNLDNLITLQNKKVEQCKQLKKYMLQNMFV